MVYFQRDVTSTRRRMVNISNLRKRWYSDRVYTTLQYEFTRLAFYFKNYIFIIYFLQIYLVKCLSYTCGLKLDFTLECTPAWRQRVATLKSQRSACSAHKDDINCIYIIEITVTLLLASLDFCALFEKSGREVLPREIASRRNLNSRVAAVVRYILFASIITL